MNFSDGVKIFQCVNIFFFHLWLDMSQVSLLRRRPFPIYSENVGKELGNGSQMKSVLEWALKMVDGTQTWYIYGKRPRSRLSA